MINTQHDYTPERKSKERNQLHRSHVEVLDIKKKKYDFFR
jgi:hypothetical protein